MWLDLIMSLVMVHREGREASRRNLRDRVLHPVRDQPDNIAAPRMLQHKSSIVTSLYPRDITASLITPGNVQSHPINRTSLKLYPLWLGRVVTAIELPTSPATLPQTSSRVAGIYSLPPRTFRSGKVSCCLSFETSQEVCAISQTSRDGTGYRHFIIPSEGPSDHS